jgi:hypothetical protein
MRDVTDFPVVLHFFVIYRSAVEIMCLGEPKSIEKTENKIDK